MRVISVVLGVAVTCAASLSSNAAQTYKVPLSVVPGSVTLTRPGGPTSPSALPISQFGSEGGCSGTYSAEVVNDGLEIELDGGGTNCTLTFAMVFHAQITVPELGGTATLIRLEGDPVVSEFDALDYARIIWRPSGGTGTTSSSPNRSFDCSAVGADYELASNRPNPYDSITLPLLSMIPGDTVTCRSEIEAVFRANGLGTVTSGRLRLRYEFRVTVPEPSASLSIPVGAGALALLSRKRGS